MTLRLVGFTGEQPRVIPRLLPDIGSQAAFDTRMENGDLRPIRLSKKVFSAVDLPTQRPATIYRFLDTWLYWETLVHATPGPVATDRLYYTGDGAPKMRVASTVYDLAFPAPATALTATIGGVATSDEITDRRYVYTNVSQFGEESEPCPISNLVEWKPGNTVTLSGFSTAMGDRTATTQRIYRSQSTSGGQASLYLIAERAAAATDYVDSIAPDQFDEEILSVNYNAPPAGLRGLIPLPNGMMAAFDGKRLYFSEPFIPHAWPEQYVLTTDFEIVALGAFGTTIVVMTKGNPYMVSGVSPEAMTMEKLELNLPCINAAGVVDLGYAIAYPSYDGLVMASSGGVRLATEAIFTKTQWDTLIPETMVAGQYNGRYLASYLYNDRFGVEFRGCIILDTTGQQPFLLRTSDEGISYFYDQTTGELFFLKDGVIRQWDAPGWPLKTQAWRSKEFVLPKPTNFGAILIEAEPELTTEQIAEQEDLRAEIIAENEILYADVSIGGELNGGALDVLAINDDTLQTVPLSEETVLGVNIYADGKLVQTVTTFNKVARLKAGFKARVWEIEVNANVPVTQIALARTPAELQQVP